MLDIVSKHEQLLNSEDNRAFAEFKVSVSSLAQEIKILKAKQNIELEDLRNQQNYLEAQIIKKQGQKRDLEEETDNLKDREDEFQTKMDEIEKLVMLKKRFVLQCERLKGV